MTPRLATIDEYLAGALPAQRAALRLAPKGDSFRGTQGQGVHPLRFACGPAERQVARRVRRTSAAGRGQTRASATFDGNDPRLAKLSSELKRTHAEEAKMKPPEVSMPDDTCVMVKRTFEAPVHLVWRAYTEAPLLKRWCPGLPGWSMHVCEMEVRKGGKYRWRWREKATGNEFGFSGEFLEIDLHRKIVHTQVYDPGDLGIPMGDNSTIITVELQQTGGMTLVTTTIAFATKEDRDAGIRCGMTDGMEISYQNLDNLLTTEGGNP